VVQAGWTSVWGVGRWQLLALMAAVSGGVGMLVARALAGRVGIGWGLAAGMFFLALPLVQQYGAMVMAELLSAAWMFGAALLWGRYLEREQPRDAWGAGVLAALAILTKGTGLALALAFPLAILFSGRWGILRRVAPWGGAAVVAVVAGPWTVATRKLGHGGWLYDGPRWEFTREAVPYYATQLGVALGGILVALTLGGIWLAWRGERRWEGRWASALALIVAVLVFQAVLPVGMEARHLVPALPAALMFAALGGAGLAREAGRRGVPPALVAGGLAAAWFLLPLLVPPAPNHFGSIGKRVAPSPFKINRKAFEGHGPVVESLLARAPAGARFLVSGDVIAEGMFISGVALRDRARPGHTAQRASKVLGESTWRGRDYAAKFGEAAALKRYVEGAGYAAIVVDSAMPSERRRPHHAMLEEVMREGVPGYGVAGTFPVVRAGETHPAGIAVYAAGQ
jgi:hypothetical protein